MLPTPQAEQWVTAIDQAESQAAGAGRAVADTASELDTVARRLAGAWAGHAGERARQGVEDARIATTTLSGHCLFLADVLRVEGSWLARALLAGGSEAEVEDADRVLAGRLSEAADALAGYSDPDTAACLDLAASTDGDPRATADLWHSLDPAERQRLARDHPELGSVAGVSSATRDALNRTRLSRLLEGGGGVGVGGGGRGGGGFDRASLAALAEHLDRDPGRHLLALHPGEDGVRAVVASADPDVADRVVTLIPGTGSSVGTLDRTAERADAMCEAAGEAEADAEGDAAGALVEGRRVADIDAATDSCVAVSWQGYEAPANVVGAGVSTDRATAHTSDLRAFAAGLDEVDVADGGDAPHTAVGYSYGSAVLGAAASDPRGLAADRMVHVGSAGATVDSIGEQWMDEGGTARPAADHEVVGVVSRWDPVPWWSVTGILGGRPGSEEFGGIAVDVSEPDAGPGAVTEAHSRYFDPGTVSLDEIGRLLAQTDAD